MTLDKSAQINVVRSTESLKGWAPIELEFGESLPVVKWRDLKDIDFGEPMFLQTLRRLRQSDDLEEISTGIEELLKIQATLDCIEPTGFIFHVSRCGSTFISNALRALENTIVMCEAQPVVMATWLYFGESRKDRGHDHFRSVILRAVVRALGQRKLGTERRYFIKFSNLEVIFLEHLKRLWPTVPWLFVIRDPIEVIVSNLRKGATWTRFQLAPEVAARVLGCSAGEVSAFTPEEYCARVIGRTCRSAVEHANGNSMFMDYSQLTLETIAGIAKFFGIEPSDAELLRIEKAATLYSKDPSRGEFVPDVKAKQEEASGSIRWAAERWATEDYLNARAIAERDVIKYI